MAVQVVVLGADRMVWGTDVESNETAELPLTMKRMAIVDIETKMMSFHAPEVEVGVARETMMGHLAVYCSFSFAFRDFVGCSALAM